MCNKTKNINKDSADVYDLISKVEELAKRGVDGEKVVAQKKLNELCLKYGVVCNEIDGFESIVRSFKYHNTDAKIMLSHCIWDVLPNAEIQNDSLLKTLFVVSTIPQLIKIKERYKYYSKKYKEESKKYLNTFILKNNIGVETKSFENTN